MFPSPINHVKQNNSSYSSNEGDNQPDIEELTSMKVSLIEKLLQSKKKELNESLSHMPGDESTTVLYTKNKVMLGKSQRGSRYRGVSKNGKKWQVQLLGNLRKRYIGSISSEECAARIYDHYAIINHGLKAKTNFNYSKQQMRQIAEAFNEDDMLNPGKQILQKAQIRQKSSTESQLDDIY